MYEEKVLAKFFAFFQVDTVKYHGLSALQQSTSHPRL